MKDIGKLKVAKLAKPNGGFLGGRYIPKERLNHNSWAQLLRVEKPPNDGPYILKSSLDPENVKQTVKDVRKTMEVNELLALLKVAAANKPKQKPSAPRKVAQVPAVLDWNEITPDQEADYLGIEQLQEGQSIAIVGAGISGLSFAYILNKVRPDVKISIYDRNEHVGGWMSSQRKSDGAIWESGPRTLLPSHAGTRALLELLYQMDALKELVGVPSDSPTNTKGLVYDNKVVELPTSVGAALKFLSSPLLKGLKLPLLRELWRKPRDEKLKEESVGEFVSRRFDAKFNDRIISALMRGIYGADSNILSARSVARFKRMYYLEKTEQIGILTGALSGSLSYLEAYARKVVPLLAQSLVIPERKANEPVELGFNPSKFSLFGMRNGIQSLADIFAANLQKSRNVTFHLGENVDALKPALESVTLETRDGPKKYDLAVVNTNGGNLFNESINEKINQIHYSSLAVVNITSSEDICKDWFGVLVPKCEDSNNPEGILGIIFDSSVRNASVPVLGDEAVPKSPPTMTVMIGGDLWEDMTPEEATKRAIKGVQRILGPIDESKLETRATLQRNCIPQYRVGHSALVTSIHQEVAAEYSGRVALSGMTFGRGVGVSDCILDSLFLATRFSGQRRLLYPEFFFHELWSTSRPDLYA